MLHNRFSSKSDLLLNMFRYKINYNKSPNFLGGSWRCYIYDRKHGAEYIGYGSTKKEAKDDAWDAVWRYKKNYSYHTSFNSESQPSNSTFQNFISILFAGVGIGLLICFIIAFYKGCGLFHYDPNKGNAYLFDFDDAKEGFSIFIIVTGFIIGLLIAIFYLIKKER